jgi:hypothetical protein
MVRERQRDDENVVEREKCVMRVRGKRKKRRTLGGGNLLSLRINFDLN